MESSTNFTVEDANNIHEAVLADQARHLKKYCLCDVEIEHLFPPPARMNRGYLNFILRCQCGYSPTVHVTTQFPAGRVYYKCGSTDIGNQCEFFIYKSQFEHTVFDLCCCGQPFKLCFNQKKNMKYLSCPYYPSPEGCILTYNKRHYSELR